MKDSRSSTLAVGSKRPAAHKVVVIDDHPVIRHGLAAILAQEPDLEVCGDAEDGAAGLAAVKNHRPHAVVLDLCLPDQEGLAVLKTLKRDHPGLPVLIISMHDESVVVLRALRAGALGYVAKAEAAEEISTGLRCILNGEMYLSQRFSDRLIFRMLRGGNGGEPTPVESLTPREVEILDLIGEGFSNQQVSDELGISVKTVETHRGHIRDKLGFQRPEELRRFACEWVAQKLHPDSGSVGGGGLGQG